MVLVPKRQGWELPESQVTPEATYYSRRQLLGGGLGLLTGALAGCSAQDGMAAAPDGRPSLGKAPVNPQFQAAGRPLTPESLATRYNNFYEYGSGKDIWQAAQRLPLDPWRLEVSGLVNTPRTLGLEELIRRFPLEERIYRFRCVEAWAMTLPWIGFPMRLLVDAVDPKPQARFVRFTSYHNPKITRGPGYSLLRSLPWPYTESLRLDEMMNDLAFFAVGLYGKLLPKQNGAPIRAVLPWKYGFKGAKSIVKIEFLAKQPATFWNTLVPNEYDFEANVNPKVPHPRWSQAEERLVGTGSSLFWERVPTQPYNGYGRWVASLYT